MDKDFNGNLLMECHLTTQLMDLYQVNRTLQDQGTLHLLTINPVSPAVNKEDPERRVVLAVPEGLEDLQGRMVDTTLALSRVNTRRAAH